MKETHLPVVENPLFFLDYDGTLAPIVEDPMAAYPHAEAEALLEGLEARYPVWIVTGRHLRDLGVLLGKPLQAIGLHGAQEGTIGGELQSLIPEHAQAALARLRRSVPDEAGVRLEEKGPTFAIHYRGVADEALFRRRFERWLADLPEDLEAIWGKKVLELRAKGLSKGTAVRRLAEAHPDHTPVYLGDDVTDEDAFRALPEDAVTVKVGGGDTVARYRLDDVEAVMRYLKEYVE